MSPWVLLGVYVLGVLIGVVLLGLAPTKGPTDTMGSTAVALMWPVLLPMAAFLASLWCLGRAGEQIAARIRRADPQGAEEDGR